MVTEKSIDGFGLYEYFNNINSSGFGGEKNDNRLRGPWAYLFL